MELSVHFENQLVATIRADAQTTNLIYDHEWLLSPERFPVSLGMPLQPKSYGSELVLPWLMNLLPEGDPLRAMTRAPGAACQ